jgi:hypothetical protein
MYTSLSKYGRYVGYKGLTKVWICGIRCLDRKVWREDITNASIKGLYTPLSSTSLHF